MKNLKTNSRTKDMTTRRFSSMEMTSYQDGAVYSLGYLTVKKYLGKSGKTIKEAFADKYADIETAL